MLDNETHTNTHTRKRAASNILRCRARSSSASIVDDERRRRPAFALSIELWNYQTTKKKTKTPKVCVLPRNVEPPSYHHHAARFVGPTEIYDLEACAWYRKDVRVLLRERAARLERAAPNIVPHTRTDGQEQTNVI